MQSYPNLWETNVLDVIHLIYYLHHAHLPLSGTTHALLRFTILDPKGRDSAMSSCRARKVTYRL
jgi:hypothetical protein